MHAQKSGQKSNSFTVEELNEGDATKEEMNESGAPQKEEMNESGTPK